MKKKRFSLSKNIPPKVLQGLDPQNFVFDAEKRLILREMIGLRDRFVLCTFSDLKDPFEIRPLLRLMLLLKESRPETSLFIFGRGPVLPEIAATCEYDDLMDSVLPQGDTNDPASFFCASDVLLLPKRLSDDAPIKQAAENNRLPVIFYPAGADPEKIAEGIERRLSRLSVR